MKYKKSNRLIKMPILIQKIKKFIKYAKVHIVVITLFSTNLWAENSSAKFISIADIHFNPFADCSVFKNSCKVIDKLRAAKYQEWATIFSQYGDKAITSNFHDTNYPLLVTTLNELQRINQQEKPAFVLILGDFLGHDFRRLYKKYSKDKTQEGYQAFVKKTLQYLTYEFEHVFPNIDVYPVVGNNDTYSGDYKFIPKGQFFQDATDIWSVLIKNKINQLNFKKEFPIAGYYKVMIPLTENHQLIILNTVLFSAHNRNKTVKEFALGELQWLNKQLQEAEEHHQKILLAYHIPAGIDVYATLKAKFRELSEFWYPGYSEQLKNELQKYPNSVSSIFAGHIHMDTYQAITLRNFANTPVRITPSISPIYGNNPGFKVITYDTKTLQLKRIDTYSYPLNQKTSPSIWTKDSLPFIFDNNTNMKKTILENVE